MHKVVDDLIIRPSDVHENAFEGQQLLVPQGVAYWPLQLLVKFGFFLLEDLGPELPSRKCYYRLLEKTMNSFVKFVGQSCRTGQCHRLQKVDSSVFQPHTRYGKTA